MVRTSKECILLKKHNSVSNLKLRDRSAMPRKEKTVAILAVMATRTQARQHQNNFTSTHAMA